MKKLFVILITIALVAGVAAAVLAKSPDLASSIDNTQYAYMKQAHGTHGLGNVNQFFNGVQVPPPWDLPPGRQP